MRGKTKKSGPILDVTVKKIGILDYRGDLWTADTFDNALQAESYVLRTFGHNKGFQHYKAKAILEGFKLVPVLVTVTALKNR